MSRRVAAPLRRVAVPAWALVALVFSGCYRMTIHMPASQPDTELERSIFVEIGDQGKWHNAVLWGLVDLGETPTYKLCPNGAAAVHSRLTFLNMLVWNLTWGIYAPQTNAAVCAHADTAEPPPAAP